ncbi:MAG: SEC-C domain-containing protein [Phycisphaerae bacterium]|nr:SEC-C domain-containing protein [Phycisphaerae bacterium]
MAKRVDDKGDRFHEREKREKEYSKQLPTDDEPPLPEPVEPIRSDGPQPKRNDPCPCGSGKKYKQCCGKPG